ncbi:MAG: hypothetical protein JRD94_18130 [Deltaproteobacteria bacterium]|nr:hypothetical protein [Deltaproteobacteria bacterium]
MVEVREVSANVSTNLVYLLVLDDGHAVVAKCSSYGSYVHFRQDHYRIHEWIHRLRGTRYASFLAPVLLKNDEVFTYRDEDEWVVFYGQQPFYDFLPKVLTDEQVHSLGREMGLFHRSCTEISDRVKPSAASGASWTRRLASCGRTAMRFSGTRTRSVTTSGRRSLY